VFSVFVSADQFSNDFTKKEESSVLNSKRSF